MGRLFSNSCLALSGSGEEDSWYGGDHGNHPGNPGEMDIINEVEDPCLHAMVEDIIDRDVVFTIEETMDSIFNNNDEINLTFIDYDFNDTTTMASASPLYIEGTPGEWESFRFRVNLDKERLPNASREYIGSTIMHEVLHAYYSYKFNGEYTGLDHETMAVHYIDWFMEGLSSMFPTLTEDERFALAWGGLEETDSFDQLTGPQKDKVNLHNGKHSKGESGNTCLL